MEGVPHQNSENVDDKHPLRHGRESLRHGKEKLYQKADRWTGSNPGHKPQDSQKSWKRETANSRDIPASRQAHDEPASGDQPRRQGAHRGRPGPQQTEEQRAIPKNSVTKAASHVATKEDRDTPPCAKLEKGSHSTPKKKGKNSTGYGNSNTPGRGPEEDGTVPAKLNTIRQEPPHRGTTNPHKTPDGQHRKRRNDARRPQQGPEPRKGAITSPAQTPRAQGERPTNQGNPGNQPPETKRSQEGGKTTPVHPFSF